MFVQKHFICLPVSHSSVEFLLIYMRSIDIKTGKICGEDKGTEPTVSGEYVCPKDFVVAITI